MPLLSVPEDVHRHARHGVLPPADRGRDGEPRDDPAHPRLSATRHRRSVGIRRADGGELVGTRRGLGRGGAALLPWGWTRAAATTSWPVLGHRDAEVLTRCARLRPPPCGHAG